MCGVRYSEIHRLPLTESTLLLIRRILTISPIFNLIIVLVVSFSIALSGVIGIGRLTNGSVCLRVRAAEYAGGYSQNGQNANYWKDFGVIDPQQGAPAHQLINHRIHKRIGRSTQNGRVWSFISQDGRRLLTGTDIRNPGTFQLVDVQANRYFPNQQQHPSFSLTINTAAGTSGNGIPNSNRFAAFNHFQQWVDQGQAAIITHTEFDRGPANPGPGLTLLKLEIDRTIPLAGFKIPPLPLNSVNVDNVMERVSAIKIDHPHHRILFFSATEPTRHTDRQVYASRVKVEVVDFGGSLVGSVELPGLYNPFMVNIENFPTANMVIQGDQVLINMGNDLLTNGVRLFLIRFPTDSPPLQVFDFYADLLNPNESLTALSPNPLIYWSADSTRILINVQTANRSIPSQVRLYDIPTRQLIRSWNNADLGTLKEQADIPFPDWSVIQQQFDGYRTLSVVNLMSGETFDFKDRFESSPYQYTSEKNKVFLWWAGRRYEYVEWFDVPKGRGYSFHQPGRKYNLTFSADESWFTYLNYADPEDKHAQLYLVETATGQVTFLRDYAVLSPEMLEVSISPDGRTVIMINKRFNQTTAEVLDTGTLQIAPVEKFMSRPYDRANHPVVWSADSRYFAKMYGQITTRPVELNLSAFRADGRFLYEQPINPAVEGIVWSDCVP
jgi:hypothetical protein